MDRTKKAFIAAQKNGLIKMVNHQIKSVYLEGSKMDYWVVIELYSNDNPLEIRLSIRDVFEFMKIFRFDKEFDINNEWNTNQLINKYIRLCYYMTPENEMHQLADEMEFVGIKHIVDDDPECEFTYIDRL